MQELKTLVIGIFGIIGPNKEGNLQVIIITGQLSPSAPFAPSAPEADDDNSTSKGIGMYPMKLDYIPNPRAGPGSPPEVPATQAVVRHEPWKPGDLVAWQAKMLRL